MTRATALRSYAFLIVFLAAVLFCSPICDMKVYLPNSEKIANPTHAYLLFPTTNNEARDASATQSSSTISLDAFARHISQWMGFASFDVTPSQTILSAITARYNMWNRPRALAVIHLDGVSTDAVSRNPSSKLASLLLGAQTHFELSPDSHVRDAIDRTADLLRLSTDDSHIATKLSKTIPMSLIYGGSPQAKFTATVLSKPVHTRLSQIHSKLPNTYERLSEEFEDSLLLKLFRQIGVQAQRVGNKITFQTVAHHTSSDDESFDLGDANDHAFLSKIEYALSLAANLANDQYSQHLSDSAPDVFVFDLSASSSAMNQRSATVTKKTLMAWNIVGHTIEQLTNTLSKHYGDKYIPILHVSETNQRPTMTDAVKESLTKSIGKGLDSSMPIDSALPCVSFKSSITAKQKGRLCRRIQSRAQTHDIHVDCPVYSERIAVYSQSLTSLKQSNGTSQPTDNEVVMYQISLWTGLALIVATFATVSGLAFMSVRYDTLLYFPSTSRAKME
eukprot:TRINITY_DN3425_c0_g1_i1.p1 TRINITY_DN3425_c0_g1~~TRINITY_DN3425_c0_g1_i1.p1  ORF type:complete len:505 (+),score=103.50 TRINITY_DN3425_c0_g1_i1:45-1559(+)